MFHEDNINAEDKCSGTENILPLSKELGLFYLKVREFYVLPVKIAKNIMDDVVKLLSHFKEEMEAAVQSTIDRQKISDFESVWNEIDLFGMKYRDVLNNALRKYPVLRDRMVHQGIYYVSIFCCCGQVPSIVYYYVIPLICRRYFRNML